MTQTIPDLKLFTFEEFIEWYPNDSKRYELYDGVIIEMAPPTGDHESVFGFLAAQITFQFMQIGLPYLIPKTGLVKTSSGKSAYIPDLMVINRDNLKNEPLWKKESTVIYPESVPLVVEVVSTNWQDDYYKKFADYEILGIPEYWIVDYDALGGRKFIGNPKVKTVFICELVDGEYQMISFRGTDRIVSPTFPQLNLTAQQIFDSVAV
ncbi:MAG: Uma2 family endonuclease [Cyanomargarita calcarea GSE-NOS-MK-12-04C]|jgi:Uma2 family endonuclease|uniref:Uma2 family endonuclease n=1 Tax=Cyanomargarita calcarea GSE-NOS-MK-12-04C TaxID=2839659 RepID=A0A951QPR5_9CYAN|nr:Uma2 family endonuclease [Cyanomargarita calcarea GSE-NOS-MK-12-04C]